MEKYINEMKHSTELLDTILVGLEHIQKLLSEGKIEFSILLFEDTVQAFSMIETSIERFLSEFLTEELPLLTDNVRSAIQLIVSAYESKNYAKVQEALQFALLPKYKKWKHELDKMFNSYLLS
jgi:hypothetical protein